MKILPEVLTDFQFYHDPSDLTQTYFYGSNMKNLTHLLKDTEEKDKFITQIYTIQNTDWPTLKNYHDALSSYEKNLSSHISIHKDPFLL